MAVGSLKMSIRVSQEERLNGGGPRPAAEKAVGLRYKPPTRESQGGGGTTWEP